MSRLGLGCARLGSVGAGAGVRESIALVRGALDHGVTFFDTSDAYGAGSSEHVLGRALRGRRDEVTIATKGGYVVEERSSIERWARMAAAGALRRVRAARRPSAASGSANYAAQDFTPAHLTTALDGSLRRLRTDHIDIYQLHGPRELLPDACAWAHDVIAAGKIGRFGVGAEDLDQATVWIGVEPTSVVQLPFGLLDPQAAAHVIPAACRSGVQVVARGVLGAGLLDDRTPTSELRADPKWPLIEAIRTVARTTGLSPIQLALWFVLARPAVAMVVVGASSTVHVADLASAASRPPDPDVVAALDEVVGVGDSG